MPGVRPMAVMATASSIDWRVELDAAQATADTLSYCRNALFGLRGALFCAVLGDGAGVGAELPVDVLTDRTNALHYRKVIHGIGL